MESPKEVPVYAEGVKTARKMVHSNPNIVVYGSLVGLGSDNLLCLQP